MSQTQHLDIQHHQSLVMTQQLQQSIKILQLSSVELLSYINQELENNPLLMQQEADSSAEGKESEASFDEEEETWTEEEGASSAIYEEGNLYYEQSAGTGARGYENPYNIEDNADIGKTLREHIIEQIYVDIVCPKQRIIAFHLADMLDENGYLTESDFTPLAKVLECELKEVEDTLNLVQRFDPAGVFARSLAECLTLQLKDKNRFDPAMAALLSHLDLLAKGDLVHLRKVCAVSNEDLKDMILEIKALNPKPGSLFSKEQSHILQPDVFLRKGADGAWMVELNNEILPKLLVNRRYYAEVKSKTKDKEARKYISDQLYTANWLIKALDQRAQTILRVATEIVYQQQEFFEKGIRFLKPMKLSDIASMLNLHESTVSRVTTNKYIATHLGLYEMKYFFSSSLTNTEGENNYSSKTVKYLIKQLIDKETPDQVLSDDKIAELLQKQNIDVARRTVAKYREAMHIPSSSRRKREKRIAQSS